MEVTPGWKSSEFWLHLAAHFVPGLLAAVVAAFAPDSPAAVASVAAITSVASHYAAGQYADNRTALKQAATDAAQAAVTTVLSQAVPAPGPDEHK
jgi:hypothetical protein